MKVAYLLEFGDLKIPDTLAGRAVRHLAAKGINEGRSFVACARAGSSWGALHHVRAMIELLLSSHHLVCPSKPSKQQKRLKKFEEYPYLRALMPHLVVEEKRRLGKTPTERELERAKLLIPARIEELQAHESTFNELWGGDELTSVAAWHHSAMISNLLQEQQSAPVKLPAGIADHEWDRRYEHMCHATHVSPSAHFLLGMVQRQVPILGAQQDPVAFHVDIIDLAEAFVGSLARWDLLAPDCHLFGRTRSEIDSFYGVLKSVSPDLQRAANEHANTLKPETAL